MALFFAGVVVVALALMAIGGVYYYYYFTPEEPTQPPKPKPVVKVEEPLPPKPKPAFDIPPWVPRNLATIKTIAEVRPDIILNIVRRWLREDKSPPKP